MVITALTVTTLTITVYKFFSHLLLLQLLQHNYYNIQPVYNTLDAPSALEGPQGPSGFRPIKVPLTNAVPSITLRRRNFPRTFALYIKYGRFMGIKYPYLLSDRLPVFFAR